MAQHWAAYTAPALTDRQIRALDKMAEAHNLGDGLDVLAFANGMSRSKAGRAVGDRLLAQQMVDAAFRKYGRR